MGTDPVGTSGHSILKCPIAIELRVPPTMSRGLGVSRNQKTTLSPRALHRCGFPHGKFPRAQTPLLEEQKTPKPPISGSSAHKIQVTLVGTWGRGRTHPRHSPSPQPRPCHSRALCMVLHVPRCPPGPVWMSHTAVGCHTWDRGGRAVLRAWRKPEQGRGVCRALPSDLPVFQRP